MVAHVNFYETLKEAQMRLLNTVVLYDGRPYYVVAITNHKGDGVFRMYLDDLLHKDGPAHRRINLPSGDYPADHPSLGSEMDAFVDGSNNKDHVIRKMMNSPSFGKFRPFPLGMVNVNGSVFYTERQPTRSTYQGLTQQMVNQQQVSILPKGMLRDRGVVSFTGRDFAKTVVGDYPSPGECLKALSDPRVANEGAAFHRNFALFRGPLDIMFLAYKGDVVGVLSNHDFSVLSLGRAFRHCKEAVADLEVFSEIKIRD